MRVGWVVVVIGVLAASCGGSSTAVGDRPATLATTTTLHSATTTTHSTAAAFRIKSCGPVDVEFVVTNRDPVPSAYRFTVVFESASGAVVDRESDTTPVLAPGESQNGGEGVAAPVTGKPPPVARCVVTDVARASG